MCRLDTILHPFHPSSLASLRLGLDLSSRSPPVTEHVLVQGSTSGGITDVVPVSIVRPATPTSTSASASASASPHPTRFPAVVWLHGTGDDSGGMMGDLASLARRGYLAVSFDLRYHGVRAVPSEGAAAVDGALPGALAHLTPRDVYQRELLAVFCGSSTERPFLLDPAWDTMAVVDYLSTRNDVDHDRIGVGGISLGGMIAWIVGALDPRVAVVLPILGIQHWQWAVEVPGDTSTSASASASPPRSSSSLSPDGSGVVSDRYRGRVESLSGFFDAAAATQNKKHVDVALVRDVWHRLLPHLVSNPAHGSRSNLSETTSLRPDLDLEDRRATLRPAADEASSASSWSWDTPFSLPWLAPRPLCIITGELDPRCPLPGLAAALPRVEEAYRAAGVPELLHVAVFQGAGHEYTPMMRTFANAFLDTYLLCPTQDEEKETHRSPPVFPPPVVGVTGVRATSPGRLSNRTHRAVLEERPSMHLYRG